MDIDHLPPPAWLAAQPGDVLTIAAGWLMTAALTDLSEALDGPVIRAVPYGKWHCGLAAELEQHGTDLGIIAGLTAHRPISDTERMREHIPVSERSEWQNLLREMSRKFDVDASDPIQADTPLGDFLTPQDGDFRKPDGSSIRILVAPSRDVHRRADTVDSADYLTRRITPAQRGRVLIITSAIYAPYQFFAVAPRLLAAGTKHAEVVGTLTQGAGDKALLARRIAQEIHATINAAYQLWYRPASSPSVESF